MVKVQQAAPRRNIILDQAQVLQKLRRMAFEMLEFNLDEPEIVLVGIYDKGYDIASRLQTEMKSIASVKLRLVRLDINKDDPTASEIKLDCPPDDLRGKCVILVDDVLNSGRTMAYGMSVLLSADIKRLETATLVDRSHKRFPISANYKGFELATTIDEHVDVVLGKDMGVYLY